MPESPLPSVLRTNLSSFEQAVLTHAARDGVAGVVKEVDGAGTVQDATALIERTRAKAARLLADAHAERSQTCPQHGPYTDRGRGCPACTVREGGGERPKPGGEPKSNGHVPEMAPASARRPRRARREAQRASTARPKAPPAPRKVTVEELQQMERQEWPHTEGCARRQVPPPGNELEPREVARMKREHEGMHPRDSILPPEGGEARASDPGEGGATQQAGAGDASPPVTADTPPVPPPAPELSSSTEVAAEPSGETNGAGGDDVSTDTSISAQSSADVDAERRRTMPQRAPGELRSLVLDIIREHGPIRQAEVRAMVGIGSPQMAGLVRQLEAQLVIGDLVERSPLLSLADEPADVEPPAAPAPEEPVAEEPAEPEPAAAAPAVETPPEPSALSPEQERMLTDIRRRVADSFEESQTLARRLVREASEMAETYDVALPDEWLRARYVAALLKRIEQGDYSPDLLDRFERLSGLT